MIDFYKQEILIGDEVIYIKLIRTGSSSSRKCMFKGYVKGFTKNKVIIQPTYSNEFKIDEDDDEVKIYPSDVYVIGE